MCVLLPAVTQKDQDLKASVRALLENFFWGIYGDESHFFTSGRGKECVWGGRHVPKATCEAGVPFQSFVV